jgi:hypothetical protein
VIYDQDTEGLAGTQIDAEARYVANRLIRDFLERECDVSDEGDRECLKIVNDRVDDLQAAMEEFDA